MCSASTVPITSAFKLKNPDKLGPKIIHADTPIPSQYNPIKNFGSVLSGVCELAFLRFSCRILATCT